MNFEKKVKTTKKIIKYALDELGANNPTGAEDILDALLDRMDDGTDVKDSMVPNRLTGDLSLKEEIKNYKIM